MNSIEEQLKILSDEFQKIRRELELESLLMKQALQTLQSSKDKVSGLTQRLNQLQDKHNSLSSQEDSNG